MTDKATLLVRAREAVKRLTAFEEGPHWHSNVERAFNALVGLAAAEPPSPDHQHEWVNDGGRDRCYRCLAWREEEAPPARFEIGQVVVSQRRPGSHLRITHRAFKIGNWFYIGRYPDWSLSGETDEAELTPIEKPEPEPTLRPGDRVLVEAEVLREHSGGYRLRVQDGLTRSTEVWVPAARVRRMEP